MPGQRAFEGYPPVQLQVQGFVNYTHSTSAHGANNAESFAQNRTRRISGIFLSGGDHLKVMECIIFYARRKRRDMPFPLREILYWYAVCKHVNRIKRLLILLLCN